MADIIARFKGDTSDLDTKIKKGSQTLLQMKADCEKVGGAFINLEKNEVDFIKSLGQMETGAKSAKGTVGELTKAFTDMSAVYNRLTEEEKADEGGRALRASLDQLKDRIKEGKAELKSIDGEIGNSSNLLEQLSGKLGVNVKQLGTWGAAIGAGKVALDVMKDSMMSNESMVDEWGRTVQSSSSLYDSFVASLNNASLDSFFQNIQNVINKAREAYDALDNLATKGGITSNNEARLNYLKSKQMAIINDKSATEAQRKAAQAELVKLNAQSKADKKTVAGLNNDVVKSKIAQLLTNNGFKEGTRGYNDAYQKVVQSLYDPNMKMGTVNTGFQRGMEISNGKTTRYTDNGNRNLDNIVTDAWRSEVNPYVQAVWNNLQQAEDATRMTNRFAQKAVTSTRGGGSTTTTKEIIPKATITESLTELQVLEDQLQTVRNSMKAYGETTDEWQAMNEEAKSLTEQIDAINGKPLSVVTTSSLSQLQIMEDQLATIKASMENAADAEEWKEMADEAERLGKAIKNFKGESDPKKAFSLTDNNYFKGASMTIGGVGQIGSALQNMGVDLGKGFDKTVGAIQGVFSIIEGVQAIISAIQLFQSANDTVQTGLLGTIAANTAITAATSTLDAIIPFHNGGIVHAANGVFVPGLPNGGRDTVPAMLSPGELVLNQAQQNTLADKLQQGNGGGWQGRPYLETETIWLGINTHVKRTGQGEIITSKNIHNYIR